MSERPKAAAGMVWLPSNLEVPAGGLGCSPQPAADHPSWVSPESIRSITPTGRGCAVLGGGVGTGHFWREYDDVPAAQVLEVLAEAWKQRGGR